MEKLSIALTLLSLLYLMLFFAVEYGAKAWRSAEQLEQLRRRSAQALSRLRSGHRNDDKFKGAYRGRLDTQ